MFKHKETGAKGEQEAVKFLQNNGYEILHCNWCSGKKEVDIIALKGKLLVFVEVKTRKDLAFGFPEEAVTIKKQSHIKAVADMFMEENKQYLQLRFDIISVIMKRGVVTEMKHFEDAFF
jgi:putative endonuclease